ncbi:hypothetical protein HDU93_005170 [Gonapodya sp. JEL0774]|nr:hypothetical protein HDU93_005170 [Gonapodya sp. JEL0774]
MFLDWSELVDLRALTDRFGARCITWEDFQTQTGVDVLQSSQWQEPVSPEAFAAVSAKLKVMYFKDRTLYGPRYTESLLDVWNRSVELDSFEGPLVNFAVLREDLDAAFPYRETTGNHAVHVGSMFGSSRVVISSPASLRLQHTLSTTLLPFANSRLMEVAESVVSVLGGKGTYVGAHIRLSEVLFEDRAADTVDETVQLIQMWARRQSGSTEEPGDLELERQIHWPHDRFGPLVSRTSYRSEVVQSQASSDPALLQLLQSCLAPVAAHALYDNPVVFIATDQGTPRSSSLLAPLLQAFPCTFFLSDFPELLRPLEESDSPFGKESGRLFIPLIDQAVTSFGGAFVDQEDDEWDKLCALAAVMYLCP